MTRRLLAFFAPGLLMALVSCSPKHSPLDPPSITISNNGCIANCWNRGMSDVCKKLMDECGNRLLAAMETERKREEEPPSQAFPRSNPRPRNGECPVCGTMAEKYDVPIGPYSWQIESRRIDCAHCNTTFRQWAEGKEPRR